MSPIHLSATGPRGARRGPRRSAWPAGAATALLLGLQGVGAPPASASIGTPVTYQDQAYSSAATAPSADKPQSKLWWNNGSWWALMTTSGGTVNVHRLSGHTWVNTGTVVDDRATSTGDALWTGSKLYIASRTGGSSGSIRVYRFSYNATTGAYTRDSGFPVAPSGSGGSESVTIARDSQAKLWITFTRGSKVYVQHTTTSDTTWTSPFRISGADTDVSSDDISAVVALPGGIGVMWSDQASNAFRFAVHTDGASDATWKYETPLSGTRLADDHINLKTYAASSSGQLHVAVKTSLGDSSSDPSTSPSLYVLTRSSTGAWSKAVAATVADHLTRPQLAVDTTNQQLWILQSTEGGGTVYYKRSPLSSISFKSGKGDYFIHASGASINNVSTTKDTVNATTDLVGIASDDSTHRYYHAEVSLG